jgi:hypothetical protein
MRRVTRPTAANGCRSEIHLHLRARPLREHSCCYTLLYSSSMAVRRIRGLSCRVSEAKRNMQCSARQLSACSEAALAADAAEDTVEEFRERLRRGPGLSHFTQAAAAASARPAAARTASRPHSTPTAPKSVERDLHSSTKQLLALVAKLEEQDRLTPMAVGSLLTDTHGRRHNYLRISLTERCNLVSQSLCYSQCLIFTQHRHCLLELCIALQQLRAACDN